MVLMVCFSVTNIYFFRLLPCETTLFSLFFVAFRVLDCPTLQPLVRHIRKYTKKAIPLQQYRSIAKMNKTHLSICNKSLLLVLPIVVASGILLECLHGKPFCGIGCAAWTSLHAIAAILLLALIVWHVKLNWKNVGDWYNRFRQHHAKGFKCTIVVFLLTAATGLVCFPQWLIHGHTGIGGVHGKIGFVFAVLILWHIKQHWQWFAGKSRKQ